MKNETWSCGGIAELWMRVSSRSKTSVLRPVVSFGGLYVTGFGLWPVKEPTCFDECVRLVDKR